METSLSSDSVLQAFTFTIVPILALVAIFFARKKKEAILPEDPSLVRLRSLIDYVHRNISSEKTILKNHEPALALYNVMRTLEAVHCDLVEAGDRGTDGLTELLPQLERLVKEVVDNNRLGLQLDYEEIA